MTGPAVGPYIRRAVGVGIPTNLGSSILAFALIPLILRNVGIANYGIWSLIFIFTGVTATMDIGLPRALVTLLPNSPREEANRLLSAATVLMGLLILLLFLIGLGLRGSHTDVWGGAEKVPAATGTLLLFTGIAITASCLVSSVCYSVLESTYKIHVVNICNFAQTSMTYLFAFLVSLSFNSPDALILSSGASYLLMAIVNICLVFFLTPLRPCTPSYASLRHVIQVGRGFFALGIVTTLTLPIMRWAVLHIAPGPSLVGLYDIALKIALTGNGVLTSFSVPLYSLFAGYGPSGIDLISNLARKTARLAFFLLLAGLTFTAFAGGWLFQTVLGVKDPALVWTTCILLSGWGVTATLQPYIRALWALGKTWPCTLLNLGTLVLTVAFLGVFAFIPNALYRVALAIFAGLVFDGIGHFWVFQVVQRELRQLPGLTPRSEHAP